MDYAQWPEYVKKKYALTKSRIGSTSSSDPSVEAEHALKWLYDVLTTLDAKASALMRLNGVLIAAAAFLLGLFGRDGATVLATRPLDAMLIVSSAALSALSIFACLFVVEVSWKFLGKTALDGAPGTCDCKAEIQALGDACTKRERTYIIAWRISLVASIGFVLEFLLQVVHVFSIGGKV